MAEDSEDREWRAAGRLRFEAAYAPEDSVYEQIEESGVPLLSDDELRREVKDRRGSRE